MTDQERSLLAAIRDEPDDNALRLVYADWLEERSYAEPTLDPDVRFIRGQMVLSLLPENSPERAGLEKELRVLEIKNTKVTTEGVVELKKSLPKLVAR